ncbi:hypothetical protein QNA08_11305 [Chelatococcus sp. SYSU_G07232]|uniref:Uncharacterized protein n=1 Tax=Chelatococcus albus TaxID=3047466 RepID=A0ABT7AHF9_9HYPH|nr:hypothetical protein [Chelatococcus sp. SYSU_G07232]MDJ1158820.1 hypothetical protein [Chelatococcus sp. SYSU_G07232]
MSFVALPRAPYRVAPFEFVLCLLASLVAFAGLAASARGGRAMVEVTDITGRPMTGREEAMSGAALRTLAGSPAGASHRPGAAVTRR